MFVCEWMAYELNVTRSWSQRISMPIHTHCIDSRSNPDFFIAESAVGKLNHFYLYTHMRASLLFLSYVNCIPFKISDNTAGESVSAMQCINSGETSKRLKTAHKVKMVYWNGSSLWYACVETATSHKKANKLHRICHYWSQKEVKCLLSVAYFPRE